MSWRGELDTVPVLREFLKTEEGGKIQGPYAA